MELAMISQHLLRAATAIGFTLALSSVSALAAFDPDDPAPPPPDIGAPTTSGPVTFSGVRNRHEVSRVPVVPPLQPTRPLAEVKRVLSEQEKRTRIGK